MYKRVDTCAAESATNTHIPVLDLRDCALRRRRGMRSRAPTGNKIMAPGGGPNRIGQGIEFD